MTTRRHIPILATLALAAGLFAVSTVGSAKPKEDERTASEPVPVEGRRVPSGMLPVSVAKNVFEMGIDEDVLEYLVESYAGKDERRTRDATKFFGPEVPEHDVTVRPFFVDRFEVTAAQYQRFLQSRMKDVTTTPARNTLRKILDEALGAPPEGAKRVQWRAAYALNWAKINSAKEGVEPEPKRRSDDLPRPAGGTPLDDWLDRKLPKGIKLQVYDRPVPANWGAFGGPAPWAASYPMTFVSLVEAREFADWAGKHVLLEPEWELAARGPDGNLRTWASPFKALKKSKTDLWEREEKRVRWAGNSRELLYFNAKTFQPVSAGKNFHAKEVPVDWLTKYGGASAFGAEGMIGNVAEWTDTPFLSYPGAKQKAGGVNPNPDIDRLDDEGRVYENTRYVVRGGHYADGLPVLLRTTTRIGGAGEAVMLPHNRFQTVGFRCGKWPRPGADRGYTAWRSLQLSGQLPTEGRGLKTRALAFDQFGALGIEHAEYDTEANAKKNGYVHVLREVDSISIVPLRRIDANSTVKQLKAYVAKRQRGDPAYLQVVGILQTSIELRVLKRSVKKPDAGEKKDGDGKEGEKKDGGAEEGDKKDGDAKGGGEKPKPAGGDAKGGGEKAAAPTIVEEEISIEPGRYVLAYRDRRILVLRSGAALTELGYLNPPSAVEKDDVVDVGDAATAKSKVLVGVGAQIVFPVLSHSAKPKKSFLFRAIVRAARGTAVSGKWVGTE